MGEHISANVDDSAQRIAVRPGVRSGQPIIRNTRITVWDVLGWLAAGATEQQILEDYPELRREDIRAVHQFAYSPAREDRSLKLLFDANLSRRLVPTIADLFPESTHVTLQGFAGETTDRVIWSYARDRGYSIVTADHDFETLAAELGTPPKVILLAVMNYGTHEAANLIRRNVLRITDFELSTEPDDAEV